MGWVVQVYFIWFENEASENTLGWDGQFCHLSAYINFLLEQNSFQNESYSTVMKVALNLKH